MSKKPLVIQASPMTGIIYAGTLKPNGRIWSSGKQDVTLPALVAVAQHVVKFGKPVIISTEDGTPEYEITVRLCNTPPGAIEAELAKVHFYLTQSILNYAYQEGIEIGDTFGIGEDCFIVGLFPYTKVLTEQFNVLELKCSAIFEIAVELAECFWGIVNRDSTEDLDAPMPDMDEFTLDVVRICNHYK
jgi:hypothetical protein